MRVDLIGQDRESEVSEFLLMVDPRGTASSRVWVHSDIASSRVWVHGMVIHHFGWVWVKFVFGTTSNEDS